VRPRHQNKFQALIFDTASCKMWDRVSKNGSPDSGEEGGSKKFLYSGPSSKNAIEEDPFFGPSKANNGTPRNNLPIDLDSVWSIRNVGLGQNQQQAPHSGKQSVRSEPTFTQGLKTPSVSLNTSSVYYSRHGGMKGNQVQGPLNNDQPTGAQWTSSSQSVQQSRQRQPPAFQKATEHLQESRSRFKAYSPAQRDMNDFWPADNILFIICWTQICWRMIQIENLTFYCSCICCLWSWKNYMIITW